MGKTLLQAALPIAAIAAPAALGAFGAGGALGAGTAAPAMGAFGSADMLAAGAAGGLLPGAAGAATSAAIPGSIESAGLLDMGGGNMVNPEYFVGESIGKPMFAGSPDLPFAERAGNVLGSMKDSMIPGEWDWMKGIKGMNMGNPQEQEQVARPTAIQRPNTQPATQVSAPYGQAPIQLTEAQKEMLRKRMLGGMLYG